MVYGAILAGGTGKRMENYSIPKQFILLSGKPIIIRTLEKFVSNERIDSIYIAVHKDWIEHTTKIVNAYFSDDEKININIVEGGKERLDSFSNIMNAVISGHGLNKNDILICHDSVRPFVSQQMIDDCIDATLENGLALTVVPTTDTIHCASNTEFIEGALDRDGLYNGQNPAGFNIELLKNSLDHFSDEEKSTVTGTTQLMLRLGYKLRIVKGHTRNFKITTDNDIDVAERMLSLKTHERKEKILDCTLRDGGIAVNFEFGMHRMQKIKNTLERSGVEFIECGYINEIEGSSNDRTCFDNEKTIQDTFLATGKKEGITYVAMLDYGAYDVKKLQTRTSKGIDGVRLAFHKENWRDAIECGKIILSKGYELFVQPMVTIRYSDEEFCELIRVCNEELPNSKGFYIVDSFGQMDSSVLKHFLELADANVLPSMCIGFHAHNNRQMAFSNAKTMLDMDTQHDVMIDASIMGMGKGAGNLCTELIEGELNCKGKEYDITVLYEAIAEYFEEEHKKTPWGYSLDYYLASIYSCTPSYIKIFTEDSRITTEILVNMLENMPDEKRVACDKMFAKKYMKEYLEEINEK